MVCGLSCSIFQVLGVAGEIESVNAFMQRLVGVTRPEGTTCEITYNAQGQRATYRDFNGVLHRYQYNDAGELSTMEDGEGRATQISYDTVGRITMLEDPLGGQTSHTYDANDNLAVLTDPHSGASGISAMMHLIGCWSRRTLLAKRRSIDTHRLEHWNP